MRRSLPAALLTLALAGPLPADLVVLIRDKDGKAVATVAVPPGGWAAVVERDTPPKPPEPPTPPPAPADPLSAPLQAAYAKEPADTRAADAAKLAAVYLQAARDAQVVATAGTVVLLAHQNAVKGIGDRLPVVRDVIRRELNTQFPIPADTPLTPDLRARYAAQFGRMATLLGGLK